MNTTFGWTVLIMAVVVIVGIAYWYSTLSGVAVIVK